MSDEGYVDRKPVEGEKTATAAQKEEFGHGRAAQVEAGRKGGEIAKERGAGIMADPSGYGKEGGKASGGGGGGSDE